MATHPSILTCEIPWAEKPGGLQSMGSQRVGPDCATEHDRKKIMFCGNLWRDSIIK